MSLTVVGSIAFDAVETETEKRDRLLGGAAVHFALSSSFLAETRVIGPVGDDFGEDEYAVLRARGVITDDIEHVEGGKTFFWSGRYERDVNLRHTLQTDLNVFETFEPKLSDASRAAETLFLANIQPDLQRAVREQCDAARFTALDSMNLWIDIARDSLVRTIGMVDAVLLNDSEIRELTDEPNLVRAAGKLLDMGPRVVVAKQGEYGSAMFTREGVFGLPAYPTPDVIDPTGAGDSFAGGFMGYVAAHADEEINDELLRTAMAYGTALASFNVEAFGTERMQTLSGDEITGRVEALQKISRFETAPLALARLAEGDHFAVVVGVRAEGDELEAVGAGRERADGGRRDAERAPRLQRDRLVVDGGGARAGEDDVELLVRLMAVGEGLAGAGVQALEADADPLAAEGVAGEAGAVAGPEAPVGVGVGQLAESDEVVRGLVHALSVARAALRD